MRVIVKQEHIDKGLPYECTVCPIALALQEYTGQQWQVQVCTAYSPRTPTTYYRLPPEASRFIHAFDKGEPVAPFEFDLLPLTAEGRSC